MSVPRLMNKCEEYLVFHSLMPMIDKLGYAGQYNLTPPPDTLSEMRIEVAPDWYVYSMHMTAVLTTPLNLIGVLIIVFCQTTQVQSLRWHLLTYQICSMITDFLINIGCLPVVYSPFAIGRPHGLFTKVFTYFGNNKTTEAQCVVVFVSMYITAGSVELLFFLRCQAILPINHKYKLTLGKSILLTALYQCVLIALMVISFTSAVPDQAETQAQFLKMYPQFEYLIVDENVFFFCVHVEAVHVLFLSTCLLRLAAGMAMVFLLVWMSSRALHSFQLSTRTRRMHLQLIKSLCYQISVPVVAFYGPLIVLIIPLIFTIPDTQVPFFFCLLFMSVHTSLGTLSMLYFNRPYRSWLILTLRKRTFVTSHSGSQFKTNKYFARTDRIKEGVSALF
ncbi:unnamed protein product [Caenorhabditis sp. 36 PRJEB53466]|nr:unnamed protein product [Caenorhabditis sp. 36 PRJEB53466]